MPNDAATSPVGSTAATADTAAADRPCPGRRVVCVGASAPGGPRPEDRVSEQPLEQAADGTAPPDGAGEEVDDRTVVRRVVELLQLAIRVRPGCLFWPDASVGSVFADPADGAWPDGPEGLRGLAYRLPAQCQLERPGRRVGPVGDLVVDKRAHRRRKDRFDQREGTMALQRQVAMSDVGTPDQAVQDGSLEAAGAEQRRLDRQRAQPVARGPCAHR